MKNSAMELKVGLFVLLALAALAYMTTKVSKGERTGTDVYHVSVYFNDVSGLKTGAPVEVAGIEVRDEIGGPVELLYPVGELAELQLLPVGLLPLGRVDPTQGLHASQDVVLTGFRVVEVTQGVVAPRVGDKPGQDGRLRDVQLRREFPEVGARGRLRA